MKKKKRGRKPGVSARLSQEQEREIHHILSDKTPDQLKMKFALWSREAVRTLISERYEVYFNLQYVGRLLRRRDVKRRQVLTLDKLGKFVLRSSDAKVFEDLVSRGVLSRDQSRKLPAECFLRKSACRRR